MKNPTVLLSVLPVFLTACVTTSSDYLTISKDWSPQVITVEVEVNSSGSDHKLEIKTPSMCSNHPDEDGCLEIHEGKVGIVQFVLEGGAHRTCPDPAGDTWVWQGIRLTDINDVSGTGSNIRKKVGSISTEARSDFGAKKDGNVDAATINGQYLSIRDINTKSYDIWYTLTAMQCQNSSVTATSDPRIRNHGGVDSL
jgi:hypothetical protein